MQSINDQIIAEKNKPKVLGAGYWAVGVDIEAGYYKITGKSNLVVRSSDGDLRVNTILGDGSFGVESYTCNLYDGDIIEADGKDTFTKVE